MTWSIQTERIIKFIFSTRDDNQIKYQGYRIELGEIDQALNQIKGIDESCVIFKKINNEMKIIAFLVSEKMKVILN